MLTLTVGGTLNPGNTTFNNDLNGTLTDLRGGIAVLAGSVGQVNLLNFGVPEAGDPRPGNPLIPGWPRNSADRSWCWATPARR